MSAILTPTVNTDKRQAAIARALDRAQAQSAMGSRPTLTSTRFDGMAIFESWAVRSRTGRNVYTVRLVHDAMCISTECDCQAGSAGLICWHRGASRLAHVDAIPSENRAGLRFRPQLRKAIG